MKISSVILKKIMIPVLILNSANTGLIYLKAANLDIENKKIETKIPENIKIPLQQKDRTQSTLISQKKRGLEDVDATLNFCEGKSTLLQYAAISGRSDVKVLLVSLLETLMPDEIIALITATDNQKLTALHYAVMYNHKDIAKIILDATPDKHRLEVVTAKDNSGDTPLSFAINHSEILRILIDAIPEELRASAIAVTNEFNQTLLHKVALFGQTETSKIILSLVPTKYKPTFVMAPDLEGKTALHCAAMYNNVEIAKMLLAIIAEDRKPEFIMATDRYKKTALHFAAQNGQGEMVKLLLESIPEEHVISFLTIKDQDENTALHHAVHLGCYHTSGADVAKILVEHYRHKHIEMEIPILLKTLLQQLGAWNS